MALDKSPNLDFRAAGSTRYLDVAMDDCSLFGLEAGREDISEDDGARKKTKAFGDIQVAPDQTSDYRRPGANRGFDPAGGTNYDLTRGASRAKEPTVYSEHPFDFEVAGHETACPNKGVDEGIAKFRHGQSLKLTPPAVSGRVAATEFALMLRNWRGSMTSVPRWIS